MWEPSKITEENYDSFMDRKFEQQHEERMLAREQEEIDVRKFLEVNGLWDEQES